MATRSKTSPMDNSECGVFNRIEQDAKNSVLQSTRAPSPKRECFTQSNVASYTSWDVSAVVAGWTFRCYDICVALLCFVGCYRLDEWLHVAMCFVGFFLFKLYVNPCKPEASDFYNMTFPLAKWLMSALTLFIIPMAIMWIRVSWFPTAATTHVIETYGMAFAVFEPIARVLQDTLPCFTVLSMIVLPLIGFVYCLSRVSEGIDTGYDGKIPVGELSNYLVLYGLAVAVIVPLVLSTPAHVNIRNVTTFENCDTKALQLVDANVSQCMKLTPAGKALEEQSGIKFLNPDFMKTSKIGTLWTTRAERRPNETKGEWVKNKVLVNEELENAKHVINRYEEFIRCTASKSFIYETRPHDVLTHAMGWTTRLLSHWATQTLYHFAVAEAQEVAQQTAFEKARSSMGFTKPDPSKTGIGLKVGGIPHSPCQISENGAEWLGDKNFDGCAEREPVLKTVDHIAENTKVVRLWMLCSALCFYFYFRISATTVTLPSCETQTPSGLIDTLCFGLGRGYVTFHFLSLVLYWMVAMQLAQIVWSPSKCLDLCFALALRLLLPTTATFFKTLWGCIKSALQATDKTKKKKETPNKKTKKIKQEA